MWNPFRAFRGRFDRRLRRIFGRGTASVAMAILFALWLARNRSQRSTAERLRAVYTFGQSTATEVCGTDRASERGMKYRVLAQYKAFSFLL